MILTLQVWNSNLSPSCIWMNLDLDCLGKMEPEAHGLIKTDGLESSRYLEPLHPYRFWEHKDWFSYLYNSTPKTCLLTSKYRGIYYSCVCRWLQEFILHKYMYIEVNFSSHDHNSVMTEWITMKIMIYIESTFIYYFYV